MRLAPATVLDYRELARRRLPRQLFDYIDGGAYEESTMRANVADLDRLLLRQALVRYRARPAPSLAAAGGDARRLRPRPGGRGAGPRAGAAGDPGAGRPRRDV